MHVHRRTHLPVFNRTLPPFAGFPAADAGLLPGADAGLLPGAELPVFGRVLGALLSLDLRT